MNEKNQYRAWDKKNETMIGVLKMDFMFESENGICVEGYCDCNHGAIQDHENHKHIIFPEDLILMQCTGVWIKNVILFLKEILFNNGTGI